MKMTLVIQLGAGQVQLLPDASCIHSSSDRCKPMTGIPVQIEFLLIFLRKEGVASEGSFYVALNLFTLNRKRRNLTFPLRLM